MVKEYKQAIEVLEGYKWAIPLAYEFTARSLADNKITVRNNMLRPALKAGCLLVICACHKDSLLRKEAWSIVYNLDSRSMRVDAYRLRAILGGKRRRWKKWGIR